MLITEAMGKKQPGPFDYPKRLRDTRPIQTFIWVHVKTSKSQSHIHNFGPGKATVNPDLACR